MKLRSPRFAALIAVTTCVLSGCASAPKSSVENQAAQVKVYGPGQLLQGQYEGVRYLWADSLRTAFWLPSASSETEGIASLQAEAARLGANGLINVNCIDQGHFIWSWSRERSLLCYGHAIRVR
jgi:uncharacterized protein YbjQ (UPF0145 family)